MYLAGSGVGKDVDAGRKYMKSAAQLLSADIDKEKDVRGLNFPAQLLALIYGETSLMMKNNSEAYKLLLIARQSGPLEVVGDHSWSFSTKDKEKGRAMASQWMAKRGGELKITKLILPGNDPKNVTKDRGLDFFIQILDSTIR